MMLNLSRNFHFERNDQQYNVEYIFTNEQSKNDVPNTICLILNVSVNKGKKKKHQISKPMNTLYQANEIIEKMIAEEAVLFYSELAS